MSANARTYGPFASALLLAPLLLLLIAVFVYPIGRLLLGSVWDSGFTLVHYRRLIAEPLYLTILLRTVRIAALVTLGTLILGYAPAYLISRLKGWRLTLTFACVFVPLWTSVLVRSYAWTVLLQRNGLVNGLLGRLGIVDEPLDLLYTEGAVLMAMIHILLPFMILPIVSTLCRLPVDLPRAAQILGAGPAATVRYIILPWSLPGVAAGCLIVFILALGFFITPALVGGPRTLMISTLIGQQATELLDWPFAGTLAAVILAVTLALVLAFNRVLRIGQAVNDGA